MTRRDPVERRRAGAARLRTPDAGSVLIIGLLLGSTGCGSSDPIQSSDPTAPTASVGQLIISVRTVGDQKDPDGYAFALDGEPDVTLPIDGEVRIAGLTPGSRSYALGGISSNCRLINGSLSGSLIIEGGRIARLEVEIFCLRPDPGSIFHTWGSSRRMRVIDALGRVLRELPASADKVAVSPDQERIAYNWNHDIWVADIDGSNPINLTNNRDSDEKRPDWSPDGRLIAYEKNEEIFVSESDIFVMNADGSGVTNLTPDTPEWTDGEPAWSPDGTRIVFRSHRLGQDTCCSGGNLWTIAPDGSELTQLTSGGSFDTNARFSPDGQRLVFTRFTGELAEGGTDFELYLVNADGTGLTQLTRSSARTTEADWSPDGRWIVFASRPPGEVFDLYMMRANGTDRVQLTFGERAGLPIWVP